MTPQQLARVIDELIRNADERYAAALTRVQKDLYNQLVAILKDLELKDEYIKQSSENRKILQRANRKINEVFSSALYTNAVSNYVSVIPKIDLQNVEYFSAISDSFAPNRVFIKNLQADAIATVEQYVLQDGLKSQVITPLMQILTQNVNAGGQFSGFLEQVKTYVLGNDEVEGRLMGYTRQYVKDTLFQYSRAYQQSVTEDLKLEWYLYSGGLIDTSREFCTERAGKFFHQKEIEAWAELEWKGKIRGTTSSSIFVFAGGHFCGHSIVPVSSMIVPEEVLKNYNP